MSANTPNSTPPTNGLTYIASSCTTTASSDSSTVHCRHPLPTASVISIRCSTAQEGLPIASKSRGPMTRSGPMERGSSMQRRGKEKKKKKILATRILLLATYWRCYTQACCRIHQCYIIQPQHELHTHTHLRSNATAAAMILTQHHQPIGPRAGVAYCTSGT